MKRSIPFLLILALITTAGSFLIKESNTSYTPREAVTSGEFADGAAEIRHRLLADPVTGEINYDVIREVEADLARMQPSNANRLLDLDWNSAGPDNVGGRTRAICTYRDDPSKVIIGSVTGGLYRSNNSGEEWTRVESFNDNVAVSSIARTGDGKIYVGTGHRSEGFRGNGIYVSEDDGATWSTLQDFAPSTTFDPVSVWAEVSVLVADPVINNRVWIAYKGGLARYDWGDSDVVEVLSNGSHSLSISDDGQTIIACSNGNGGGIDVHVSTNGGANFTNRSGSGFGQIPGTSVGRIEVAVSPDNPNYMYACLITTGAGHLKGLYASTNQGQTWHELYGNSGGLSGTSPFRPFTNIGLNTQGNYDCAISVVPGSPQQLVLGGIRMYLIEITGQNPPVPQWNSMNINFSQGPNPLYVHSDIHTFHWDANDVFYIGCDGGIFKSFNYGQTYVSSNYNYRSTQFYGMDFNSQGFIVAGAQDNGTHLITGYSISNNDSYEIGGGDGFDCNMSKFDPGMVFVTVYNNSVSRSFDYGISGVQIRTDEEFAGPFWTIVDLDERLDANNAIMSSFPWNTSFMEEETYAEDDMIIFTENTCFDGVDYEAGDTLVFLEPFTTYFLAPGASHPYTGSNYGLTYNYTNNTGEKIYTGCEFDLAAPDPAQSLFCVGGVGAFQYTRDATKNTIAAGDIDWVTVSTGVSGTVTCFEFSPDHDNLYIGSSTGQVYRITGLNSAYTADELAAAATSITTISSGMPSITDLAVDVNNPNRLMISAASFGETVKLKISEEATFTTGSSSFVDAWNFPNSLSKMPVYSCTFDKNNPNRIFAGTEYGVWVSEDLGDSWEECNGAMGRVPVYALEQQVMTSDELPPSLGGDVLNEGAIYAGTFGKGVHYIGNYVLGLEDLSNVNNTFIQDISIYPNPVAETATLKLKLDDAETVTVDIIDINGRIVQNLPQGKLNQGEQRISFNVGAMADGTYLIQVNAGQNSETARFIVKK